jgi:hypothetical protein
MEAALEGHEVMVAAWALVASTPTVVS